MRAPCELHASMKTHTLHFPNQGVTTNQIRRRYRLPESQRQNSSIAPTHVTPKHNGCGVVQRFLGFRDCNPATPVPFAPEEAAPLYVERMAAPSASSPVPALHEEERYLHAFELLNRLVFSEPQKRATRELPADMSERLGCEAENAGHRKSCPNGADELRSGMPTGEATSSTRSEVVRAMSTELFLDFLGIRMDLRCAEGLRVTMDLVIPDTGERLVVELSNATLANSRGLQAERPDLTLTVDRSGYELVTGGLRALEALIAAGVARVEGYVGILGRLATLIVEFDPCYEALPGTHQARAVVHVDACQARVSAAIPE